VIYSGTIFSIIFVGIKLPVLAARIELFLISVLSGEVMLAHFSS